MVAPKIGNKLLKRGFERKYDEYYTLREDIENELKHYSKFFKGKVVYCNCDDPEKSQFVSYFKDNFKKFGLKKLIATCYSSEDNSVFNFLDNHGKYAVVNETNCDKEIEVHALEHNGDFRSDECIEFLKKCDVVVTNPPFTLVRQLYKLIKEHNKDFLFIAPQTIINNPLIRHDISEEKIRMGVTRRSGSFKFKTPNKEKPISLGMIRWWTNLEHGYIPKLDLLEKYDPEKHRKFDNYDIVNVDKTCEIPYDYNDWMAVPISYFTKHDPSKFEIKDKIIQDGMIDGSVRYDRFLIRRKH